MASKLFRRFLKFFRRSTKQETVAVEVVDHDPAEKFERMEPIGKGGFGLVYKGRYVGKDKDLAIKTVKVKKNQEPEELEEINLLRKCRGQKNIVQLYSAMLHVTEPSVDNNLWCVMELCEGGSIKDLMNQQDARSLPEHWIQYICREVLQGLKYLHKNCIIHRDLKAMNIMLTAKGEVKIIDLGLGKQLSSKTDRYSGVAGTTKWMAPEVILSQQKPIQGYNTKCDIWSLGITAIEMAEGKAPYSKVPKNQVKSYITSEPPPTLSADIWSKEFQAFVASCLTKDQLDRPKAKQLLNSKFIRKQPHASLAQKEIAAHIRRMQIMKALEKDPTSNGCEKEQPLNKAEDEKNVQQQFSKAKEEPKNQKLSELHKQLEVQENVDVKEHLEVQEHPELHKHLEVQENVDVKEHLEVQEHPELHKHLEVQENVDVKEHLEVQEHPELHKHLEVQENVDVKEQLEEQEQPELPLNPEQQEQPVVQEEMHEKTSLAACKYREARAMSYTGAHSCIRAEEIAKAAKSF
ncbi:hypothetical protein XELAEV_18016967mg [Xenopus laevis]|uniref:Protein kinase domain-containing protein n=1 Tax=Xenopus laevis TaxID=8355 RepID=A0A974DAN7_XENLA|nr:hypothetical protein XELAEV_18016967mg [Xenopus laevis]